MLNPAPSATSSSASSSRRNQEAGVTMGLVPHPTDPILPFPRPRPPRIQAGVKDNIVRDNEFLGDGIAVWLTNGTRDVQISDNDIAASQQQGVLLERSDDNPVADNDITASGAAGDRAGRIERQHRDRQHVLENGGGIVLTITASDAGYHAVGRQRRPGQRRSPRTAARPSSSAARPTAPSAATRSSTTPPTTPTATASL